MAKSIKIPILPLLILMLVSIIVFLVITDKLKDFLLNDQKQMEVSPFDEIKKEDVINDQPKEIPPEQKCYNEGKIWCNGQCYYQCPLDQEFYCPPNGGPAKCLTKEQKCYNEGNIWCNGYCYTPYYCRGGRTDFYCPPNGKPPECKTDRIEKLKRSIVYIKHDVTGCCDLYNQLSANLGNTGSGVIINYYKNNKTAMILTSRHVVDCVFAQKCIYPTKEDIEIKTYKGKFYSVNKVMFVEKNLDLAMLEVKIDDEDITPVDISNKEPLIFSKVILIGYPAFEVESYEPVLEFSIKEGFITKTYNLLTYRGFSFMAIDTNAITGPGASGGGLFDEDGNLMGVITWGNREDKRTIAIDARFLYKSNYSYYWCNDEGYYYVEGTCCPYGTMYVGAYNGCFKPCRSPNQYCPP